MTRVNSFQDVIDLWDSPETDGLTAMASELCTTRERVRKWWERDRIPSEWWLSIVSCSKARKAGVTSEILTRFAAKYCEVAR